MRPKSAYFRPEKADLRSGRADFGPKRADFRPEKADLRSGGANLNPEMAGEGMGAENGETKLPYVES